MFLIIISCISLAIFLFSMDVSWANVISQNRNDLVFEGRNKDYGAYALRKEHHTNVFFALLLAIGLIGGGILTLRLLTGNFKDETSPISMPVIIDAIIDITPPEKKPDQPEKPKAKLQTQSAAAASGSVSTDTEIVENTVESKDPAEQVGGDGDAPTDLIQPYDPGSEGGGSGAVDKAEPSKERHIFVKNMPEFPGGMDEFMRYVQARLKYSDYELMHNVGGTMYVSFTVFPDGQVGEVIIERGIPYGDRLEKRVIRALTEMPLWKPGNNGKEPLPVTMKMPVKFELRH
jgi:periplasmic protein TonB